MPTNERSSNLRRYLLGMSTAETRAAIEVEYFESPDALDRVCEEEDDLIDDYLSGRLALDEHNAFESHYLATANHRMRVEVSRRLRTAAATMAPEYSPQSSAKRVRWLATMWSPVWAASVGALVLVAAGAVWMIRSGSAPPAVDISTSSTPGSGQAQTSRPDVPIPPKLDDTSPKAGSSTPPVQPIVVALSISPTTVRGSAAPATLTIPSNAEVVVLRLQGEVDEAPLNSGRAVVRTVAGDEVWRGPAASGDEIGTLGRIEITMRLKPEDYIVELFARDPAGGEVERHQYFFRVRQ
jgi:hypothetical protein